MESIPAHSRVSITELKRIPDAVIEAASGESVAVLVHNSKTSAYLVPVASCLRATKGIPPLRSTRVRNR